MLTVARVVSVPELALAPIHLADGQRVVGWVATSELTDPTPYLQGHELLLTTGLETAAWDEDWDAYVARLAAADVAALGLGVGLTHESVPEPLVAACEAHGLNLIAVPRPTAFVAISRAVAALLDEEAEHAAQQALDAQRQLTRAALRGEEAAVLRQLGKLVGGTAVVVDAAGADRALDSRSGRTTVVHPLGIAARPTAWLAVTTEAPLLDPHRSAISTAVALLGLAREQQAGQRAAERSRRTLAIERLITGDVAAADVLLSTAASTALPSGPVRVLRARHATDPIDAINGLLDVLEEAGVVAARLDDEVVAIVPARRSGPVATLLTDAGARVGVGATVRADQAPRGHDTAVHALAQTSSAAPARTWDDVQDSGVVALLGAAAAPYAEAWLAPLAGDPIHLETLAAYLAHHGSIGAVAAALGVHRNTVRNRVATIEDRLGRSLDDAATRAEAWLALSVAGPGGG